MKKFFILLLFCCPTLLWADPWDNLTIQQATQVRDYLTVHPYILDYCDCCSDGANSNVKVSLLRVRSTRIIPCNWDSEKFSVKAKVEKLASFSQANGGPYFNTAQLYPSESGIEEDYIVTMNYTWAVNRLAKQAAPLYTVTDYVTYEELDKSSGTCAAFVYFPDPEIIKNNHYSAWYPNRWTPITAAAQGPKSARVTQVAAPSKPSGSPLIFEKTDKLSFGKGQPKFVSESDINLSGDFTICLTLKRAKDAPTGTAVGHGALREELLRPGHKGKALFIGFSETGQFYFSFYGDDFLTPKPMKDTKWHSYVCTYNVQTRERTVYMDGIAIGQNVVTTNYLGKGKFYIGGTSWHIPTFEGDIKDVKVYNKVMTLDELK